MTIIESHASLAEALHGILEQAGFAPRLADPAGTLPATLVGSIVQRSPDVVILGSDLDLGLIGAGTRLVAPLVEADLPVIVLAGHVDDPVRWGICLSEGATAIVRRSVSLDDFLALVRAVADGSFVPPPDQQALQRAVEAREYDEQRSLLQRVERLTSRELEILIDLTRGWSASEIATAGFVSEGTVRTQIRAILTKLEVSSQLAAVAIAHQTGL